MVKLTGPMIHEDLFIECKLRAKHTAISFGMIQQN